MQKKEVNGTTMLICSNCGGEMVMMKNIVFTSNPVCYRYTCKECGAVDYDREYYPNKEDENVYY